VQILHHRSTSQLVNGLTHIRRLTADLGLDLVAPGDARQHFGRER